MREIEINNEIILLRQSVRQARICVINKLIREAKRLRSNRGNEKQLEKNKSKADKLLREIFSLKRIKDDEVSKFGIINLENLQDILQNPNTDDGTRAMAKVARYKSLNARIIEFKEKFPDYGEYISWRKKKHSLKRKANRSADDFPQENSKRLRNSTNDTKAGAYEESAKDTDRAISVNRLQCITRQQNKKINGEYSELSEELSRQKLEGNECKPATKIISKEAAVKRFAEILQETDRKEENSEYEGSNNLQSSNNEEVECVKKVDDFFLNSGEGTSSITVISKERSNDCAPTANHNTFELLQVKSQRGKFYKDNEQRKSKGTQKVKNKDTSCGQSGTTTRTNVSRWKRNRDIQIEKKSVQKNIESTTNATEDKTLHPSWAARRKQQNIMKQGFQGKKIKFDEN